METVKTGSVLEICDMPQTSLAAWTQKGVVVPVVNGYPGRSKSDEFSVLQAVGIAVARAQQATWMGCNLIGVRLIIQAFAALDEAELLKEFKAKRTHFVNLSGDGRPVLGRPQYDWVDVRHWYTQVKAAARS